MTLYLVISLVVQMVNNLPAMQETQVPSLGQIDPLEKEMEAHFCIAWSLIVIDKTQFVFFSKCRFPWWLRQ